MLISIAMPTYKRLPFLKKAVADVFAQTWRDWELVISDDEEGDGETWKYVTELAKTDSRIKVLKNTRGKHGQIYNVNSALSACSGLWIKPFFDDDRMLPECLENMVGVAISKLAVRENVVMVGCRAQKWRNGVHVGDDENFAKHPVEIIPGDQVLKAMCLLDNWNGRTPTHMLMRGDIVRAGATMVEDALFRHPIDVRWFGRILEHGAFAMIDKVLVCECQGEVASGTSELWKEEGFVTEELRRVYCDQIWARAAKDKTWPSRKTIDGLVSGVRGIYHLKIAQKKLGVKYLLHAATIPSAWGKIANWCLRKKTPGSHCATTRIHA